MSKAPKQIRVTLELPENEARALAQMCKRFGWDHAKSLSNMIDRYADGQWEADHMIEAVMKLQRALADAGHAPR